MIMFGLFLGIINELFIFSILSLDLNVVWGPFSVAQARVVC